MGFPRLVARQGSGTRVADRPTAAPEPASPVFGHPPRYDLRAGAPDVSLFPRSAWFAAMRRAWTGAPAEALGYGDPRGRPELRQALATYLSRARGVHATADRIVVCAGFGQAFGLLCHALGVNGAQRFAFERYGHRLHRRIAASHGLAPHSLDVDDDGAVLDHLGEDTAGVLLTPAHQFPLGGALAPRRRAAAIAWATRSLGVVVEDDYDGEFRYDRHPVGALQALAPEHVAYAGTASKSLAPGLRLAWLVLPVRLIDDVVAAKELADGFTGSLEQGLRSYTDEPDVRSPALVLGYGRPPEHAFTAALARLAAVLGEAASPRVRRRGPVFPRVGGGGAHRRGRRASRSEVVPATGSAHVTSWDPGGIQPEVYVARTQPLARSRALSGGS